MIGTPSGGEAGVNFWGIYNQGHVNVGFTPSSAKSVVLDCRLLSTGDITYKVYEGMASEPVSQGAMALYDGHLLLIVPVARRGESISVELWPTTVESPMGFLGCEISTLK
ncbi:MAG TPA: hypothetical protein VFW40_08335 [Capsulimonadaceae bacterium]|nr:hypothetical protein [Capsulimonadaceae bacterium]